MITHRYLFTQAELKKLLGLKGDTIINIDLWTGMSPNDESTHVSTYKQTFCFETTEGNIEKDNWKNI